jgi:hypothetical protein
MTEQGQDRGWLEIVAAYDLDKALFERIWGPRFIENLAKAWADGKAQGIAQGMAKSVVSILGLRGLHPSEEQRQRILTCTDIAQLDVWFDRAVTAGSAAEVFAG